MGRSRHIDRNCSRNWPDRDRVPNGLALGNSQTGITDERNVIKPRKIYVEGGAIMLRNLLVATDDKLPKPAPVNGGNDHRSNHSPAENIDVLYTNSRSGLRGVLLFLGASIFALYFNEQSLVGSLPADIMDILGSTPSVILVNCVFGASTLSSLISIAGKIYHNLEPGNTSTHLLFRISFYLLYFISGALSNHFNMVFISGMVVLGLQHYNVWNYYLRAIELNTTRCDSVNM
jgi:hypothetical protein